MKTLFGLLLTILIFTSSALSQNYKQIKIYFSDIDELQNLFINGIDFEGASFTKDNAVKIFVNENEYNKVASLGYNFEILIDDWNKYYENLPQPTESERQAFINESKQRFNVDGFGYGSMGGFYTMQEFYNKIDTMRLQYPNLITAKYQIGTSIENRPIWAVKISDNPDIDENEPEILYTGLHHAREPQSAGSVLYFMFYLLENYATDPVAQYLINNREMYFVLVLNPDGYEYNRSTNPNGGGMWRKNRRNNGGSYGVDLNRNYGPYAYWNSSYGGSSTSPSDDTYRGTAPFSEPEVLTVKNFLAGRKIKACLNYHTSGGYLIYPYGAFPYETPDSLTFREYAQAMTAFNGYMYGTVSQTLYYNTRGGSDDFMYDGDTVANGGKIISMTPEVGHDGFWPSQYNIFPEVMENLLPCILNAYFGGEYVSLSSAAYSQPYFTPGDNISMYPTLKNRGLSSAYNLTFNLTSLSTYASIINGTASLDSLAARSTAALGTGMSFNIAANTPIEQNIKLLLTTSINGAVHSKDTISFTVGFPINIFADTTNVLANLWTVTATPANPKWEETTLSFYSAPNCYTDSKNGNYSNSATVTMTLTNSIDISVFTNPRLTFWTKYFFESGYDYGMVEVSTNNGSTWSALSGIYTQPGSGSFQPNGQPLYDGTKSEWVREEMSLAGKTSTQFKMRFKLRSDSYTVRDGWYLDDIRIFIYGAVPVELTSFTARPSKNNVELKWSTATELNNHGFEIQRADIDSKQFLTLGFIKGNGTTEEISDYTFIDKDPLQGRSLYRLKQLDYNGSFKIYEPVEVNFNNIKDYSLEQNYPNPFNPSTKINYSLPNSGLVSIKIYNLLGSEVMTLVNEYKDAGRYSIDLNLNKNGSSLTSGVYFYSIKAGSFNQTRKMLILK